MTVWMVLIGCHPPGGASKPPPPSTVDLGECGTEVGYTPRVVRMTHAQYDNSVRDLLGVTDPPSAAFIDDPSFGGFDNNAASLVTTDRLARDYQRAAEAIGESLASTPGAVAAISPCTTEDEACARQLVTSLGRRVYRRPLTDDEVDAYLGVYVAGADVYAVGSPHEQGIALVVETMLQSPYFLYRLELTEPTPGSPAIVLDGYEIATRLSFLLWNAPPDDDLLDAVPRGDLSTAEGVGAEAERLLTDPRAASMVDDFHRQLLDVERYEDLTRDPDLYPRFDASAGPAMIDEALQFARYIALESDGTYADLLTEPAGFVNRDLAPLYGLDPADFDDTLAYTPLDPTQRGGLLTLSGFLAANAYFDISSPIHRGVFVHRNLLCTDLPDPPGNADLELPPIDGGTTREIVEQHTSDPACQVCHGIINPAGFAFENFDAVGGWRTEENGHPIDATGSVQTQGGDPIVFTDGLDFSRQLAVHPVARRCYLLNWFRYGYARVETAGDACTLEQLEDRAVEDDFNLRALIGGLAETDVFRLRPATEEDAP